MKKGEKASKTTRITEEVTLYVGIKMTADEKEKIQDIADDNYRSVNGQIRYMIGNWERFEKFERSKKNFNLAKSFE